MFVSLHLHQAQAGWWWVTCPDKGDYWAMAADTRESLIENLHKEFPEGFTIQWRAQ